MYRMKTIYGYTPLKTASIRNRITRQAALKICTLKNIEITTFSNQSFLKNADIKLFDLAAAEDKPNRNLCKSKDVLYRRKGEDEFHYASKGGNCGLDIARKMFDKYEKLVYSTVIKSIKKYGFHSKNIPICHRSALVRLWDMCLQKGESLTSTQVFQMAFSELFRVNKYSLYLQNKYSEIVCLNKDVLVETGGCHENICDKIEAKDIIDKTTRVLSESELSLLRMYYDAEIDKKDMAKKLNMSRGRLSRAINTIVKKLKREYSRLQIMEINSGERIEIETGI